MGLIVTSHKEGSGAVALQNSMRENLYTRAWRENNGKEALIVTQTVGGSQYSA